MNKDANIMMMIGLIKSTTRYVHRRIGDDKNRNLYLLGIKDALSIIERSDSLEELQKSLGVHVYMSAKNQMYYKMAMDHSLDVINSIQRRFMNDVTVHTPRFLNVLDTILLEDEALFGDTDES